MIHSIPFRQYANQSPTFGRRATRILFLPEIAEDEDADAGDIRSYCQGMMRHRPPIKKAIRCGAVEGMLAESNHGQ